MYVIKRVDPVSLGKVLAIQSIIPSIILGLIISFLTYLGTIDVTGLKNLYFGTLILSFTLFPIVAIILGFILGLLGALIFNLSSKILNGLKINIELIEEPTF